MKKINKRQKNEQERWLDKAINKFGSANLLAKHMKTNRCNISRWRKLAKKIKKDENLMCEDNALLMEKATNIKGLAIKVCPSIKKFKKIF